MVSLGQSGLIFEADLKEFRFWFFIFLHVLWEQDDFRLSRKRVRLDSKRGL